MSVPVRLLCLWRSVYNRSAQAQAYNILQVNNIYTFNKALHIRGLYQRATGTLGCAKLASS